MSNSVDIWKLTKYLRNMKSEIIVPTEFKDQAKMVKSLTKNDKTGIVTTILDFMNNSANVPMSIESKNETLDKGLSFWKTNLLNKNIGFDIPRGLRELSSQFYTERWTSSFIVINIRWESVDLPGIKNILMPTKVWISDGSNVTVNGSVSDISKRKYYIGDIKNEQNRIKDGNAKSIIIRKPYDSWYDMYPTPYLVRKGVLFNALLKNAIINKQSDVIHAIIPYILTLKAGTDKLAELGQLADEESLKELKEAFVKAKEESDYSGTIGEYISTLNYDVNVEHLIPDLTKILTPTITDAVDKNLLAGLGLVEMVGFSSNRQEMILNPKVLVEEVKDSVLDWALIIEEIMLQIKEKNIRKHSNLFENDIKVIPGTVKAFVTEETKSLIRSLHDRGIISRRSTVEESLDFNFDLEVDRVAKEKEQGLDKKMYPPVIQNLEQHLNPDMEDQNKKKDTPEADNFNMAVVKAIKEAIEETK